MRVQISRCGNASQLSSIPSGFTDLDRLTLGFQRSELIIVAARPSMGKTAFVLNVAQNAAYLGHTPVAIFSLEMAKEQLVTRLLSSEAEVERSEHLLSYFR